MWDTALLESKGCEEKLALPIELSCPCHQEGLTHSHFAIETKGRNCQWPRGLQTFSNTSIVTDTGVSLTQLPVNLVCFGLKTIWKHLVLGMACWEVLLLLTFCLLCVCKYLDDPFSWRNYRYRIQCTWGWECHIWTMNASGCQSCSRGVTVTSCVDLHQRAP